MLYVIDTHSLIWYLTDDRRLGAHTRQILDNDDARLVIPSIVLAEAKHIADRKRIPLAFQEILDQISASPNVTIFPLDEFVVNHLPANLEIHDSIIIATALQCQESFQEDVALLTNDIAISQSGLIPVIW